MQLVCEQHALYALLSLLLADDEEGNLMLVFVLSLVACLEKFNWQNAKVVGVVVIAASLTFHES